MRKLNIFWNWFKDNESTIKKLNECDFETQQNIQYWFKEQLKYYCEHLDYIIITPRETTLKSEVIISANGNPDYYKEVTDLVDNAPLLKNWRCTAFLQNSDIVDSALKKLEKPYIIKEIALKNASFEFLELDFTKNTTTINYTVYLKSHTIYCNTKTWTQVLYIIMQQVVLKTIPSSNINFIQLHSKKQNKHILIEIYEAQHYIHIFK